MDSPAIEDKGRRLIVGCALALLVFVTLVLLGRPLVRGDGLAYYMWLDPVALHFSLDLSYAAERFSAVNEYQIFRSPTGAYASAFPFGPALLLAPWYRLALLLPEPTGVDLAHYTQYQADGFIRSFFVMLGSQTFTILAVLLAYRSALRVTGSVWAAAAASFALFWGTPLIYYSTVEPYMAHAVGTFLIALAVWLYVRRPVNWLALGVTLSLAVLVRWQLALLVIPIAAVEVWRRQWLPAIKVSAGLMSLAWLVPFSWYQMFDRVFVVPAAEQNMRPFLGWPVHALDVLVSFQRGLFTWSPLTLLGVVGLVALLWRNQRLGIVALTAFALQVIINGAVSDWHAGWSYGMRRLTELYPFFVIGLALLLSAPGRLRWAAWAATGVLFVFSAVMLFAHLTYINVVAGHGASAPEEIATWIAKSIESPRITWHAIKDHYGPWAWTRPGP